MHSSYDTFITELTNSKLKLTKARLNLYRILQDADRPMTIAEINYKTPSNHYVSNYRNLEIFVKHNIVIKVPHGFKFRYELGEKFIPHHHHAICSNCGVTFNLSSKHIEYLIDEAGRLSGIIPTSHSIEVVGICKSCAKNSQTTC